MRSMSYLNCGMLEVRLNIESVEFTEQLVVPGKGQTTYRTMVKAGDGLVLEYHGDGPLAGLLLVLYDGEVVGVPLTMCKRFKFAPVT